MIHTVEWKFDYIIFKQGKKRMNSSSRTVVEFKSLSGCACVPKRAYKGSAGYDLYAAETKTIKPWGREVIALDLAMAIPEGCYGRVAGGSALRKCGLVVHDGTTDSNYRGEVCVVLFNLSDEDYSIFSSILNNIYSDLKTQEINLQLQKVSKL